MLRWYAHRFLTDNHGGGTIIGLFWFMALVAICGLAVDATNGLRNRTMLQATADAAALAGTIDLPDSGAAVASAVAYSDDNMPVAKYGEVLKPGDVEVGSWNRALRSFNAGGFAPDSVRVSLHQTEEHSNAVPVNFLRVIGLQTWNVNVEAVAQRYIPDCLRDGLVARGLIDISSNNGFVNRICIHGHKLTNMQLFLVLHMQNHNYYEAGVNVSMPDIDQMLILPSGGIESNPGLAPALKEQSFDPRMVNHVDEFMNNLLAKQAYVTPSYIDTAKDVIVKDEKYNFANVEPGRIYHIQCAANKNVNIPTNITLTRVVIVSDCQVSVGSNVSLVDVILASRSGDNPGGDNGNSGAVSGAGGARVQNANINFSSGVNLGAADSCAPGGGVQIFSNASVHFSSTMTINGVQIIAKGDVDLGARNAGINGINVQTGGNITLTANNMLGLCSGGSPQFFPIYYYRLVV